MRIKKKKQNIFHIELHGEIYRNPRGAFKKIGETFIKVGTGKGNYSIKIQKIRIK